MGATSSPTRRFDIWDGSILITATLAALLAIFLVRALDPPIVLPPAPWTIGPLTEESPVPSPIFDPDVVRLGIEVSRPFLTSWTAAFLILRLRRPRASWRKLARQPGMAACGIGALVLIVQLCGILLRWAVGWLWTVMGLPPSDTSWTAPLLSPLRDLWLSIHSGFLDSAYAAHGIAGAWLIMALGGWWRPERSWIDRLGMSLGAAWIARMVVGFIAGFMQ